MRLGFIFDCGFDYYEGHYYAVNLTESFWQQRYLPYFDEIVVIGRYQVPAEDPRGKYSQSDGPRVKFRCMPSRPRPVRMVTQSLEARFLLDSIRDCDMVICRSWWGTAQCRKLRKPYLMEVISCIFGTLWTHSMVGKLAALPSFFLQRHAVAEAPCVLYVTREFLQRRYPTRGIQAGISDVDLREFLSPEALSRKLSALPAKGERPLILGSAGALDTPCKGQRFVIEALGLLRARGNSGFRYVLAGGGDPSVLQEAARKARVEDLVIFRGPIPHGEMSRWYDGLDLYLQPSLQEGLPRALVEAMSRGLPCLGTDAGGIPELLEPDCIVKRRKNMARQLADRLERLSREDLQRQARRNLAKSREFDPRLLAAQRSAFLSRFIRENS